MKTIINTVKATVTMHVSVTCNGNVKKPSDVAVRRNGLRYLNRLTFPLIFAHRSKLIAFCSMLFALCFLLFALPLEAKVTGVCSNCHTMHNSQNGQPMVIFGGTTSAQPCLLRGTCLGCHGQSASGTVNIISLGNVPQVLHATSIDHLAGGNFKYLDTDDNRGHNVIDTGNQEGTLTAPPGDQHGTGITNANFTCSGAKGCHGDRTVEDKLMSLKGAHHTDDSVLKFGTISLAGQGGATGLSYRFLMGVKGGEDSDWEATVSTSAHNEYFGDTSMAASSKTAPANNTISGLCAECHGNYHGDGTSDPGTGTASPWLRHPTDISLPASGEYTAYTTYSLTAPVARTSSWSDWTTGGGASSSIVTPSGTADDIVMCLSCHRAHASPNYKILRWDIKSTTLSTALSGCNVCHTSKN